MQARAMSSYWDQLIAAGVGGSGPPGYGGAGYAGGGQLDPLAAFIGSMGPGPHILDSPEEDVSQKDEEAGSE